MTEEQFKETCELVDKWNEACRIADLCKERISQLSKDRFFDVAYNPRLHGIDVVFCVLHASLGDSGAYKLRDFAVELLLSGIQEQKKIQDEIRFPTEAE